ncbi:MAG: hypothetical protein ACPGID_12790 [Rubricella sp.]
MTGKDDKHRQKDGAAARKAAALRANLQRRKAQKKARASASATPDKGQS